MKTASRHLIARWTATFFLLAPLHLLRADVFYSGLRNIPLPTGFDGVYLNVDNGATSSASFSGWDINPAFGGAWVYNSASFQPARVGTGNQDAIIALALGATVDASLLFSTGFGASGNHLGLGANQFQPGQEEFLGFTFRTDANSGPHYGWMRVVFTADQPGGVIRDWGYETGVTGSTPRSITTGNILQAAPAGGVSLVTLTSGTGQSYTLASILSDGGGSVTAVSKTGAGTWTLAGNQGYTGGTTVQSNGGILEVGPANGRLSGTALITVNNGGTLLLSGTGGTNVRLNVAAPVTLVGGKIDLSGMTSSLDQTVGLLTLGASASASPEADLWEPAEDAGVYTLARREPELAQLASDFDLGLGAVTLNPSWTPELRLRLYRWKSSDDAAAVTLAGGRVTTHNASWRIDYPLEELLSTSTSTSTSSVLNFGSLLAGNTWRFGASNADWSGVHLSIFNYTSGVDHLFFGSGTTALNPAQLDRILFYSDSGSTFLGSARWLGGTGEVVPIPEPGTWAAGFLAAAAVVYMRRRHQRSRALRERVV